MLTTIFPCPFLHFFWLAGYNKMVVKNGSEHRRGNTSEGTYQDKNKEKSNLCCSVIFSHFSMRLINSKICLTYTNVPTESHSKWFCLHPLNYRNSLCFSALNFNWSWWNRKTNKCDFKLSFKSILVFKICDLVYIWVKIWYCSTWFWLQLEKRWLVLPLLKSLKDQMLYTMKSCFPDRTWKDYDDLIPKFCTFRLCYLLHLISFVNKFVGFFEEK